MSPPQVSGAISMGVGGLLSAQAEVQHYRFQSRATSERVRRSCSGEMEREVIEILGPYGVPAELASQVAARLQRVEADECGTPVGELPPPAAAAVRSDGLTGPSRGLTPFILRLGEHLEEVEDARVWQSALVIGASYFIGGL
jgi:VIT1/CCC1 family predicted Fe2+/Mn2+ transporter